MGYSTEFQGTIKITPELNASQIKFIRTMASEDMRDFAPEDAKKLDIAYVQWELNDSLDGLQWDGGEKFYRADECMKYIIDKCIEKWPELRFNGIINAQGEEYDDRWKLTVKNNKVTKTDVKLKGRIIECPHCEEKFELEDE